MALLSSSHKNSKMEKFVRKDSKILREDWKDLIRLAKRMSPEQRLVAFSNHSQLIGQIYQAGVSYRGKGIRQRP